MKNGKAWHTIFKCRLAIFPIINSIISGFTYIARGNEPKVQTLDALL